MKCPNCGADNPAGSQFCGDCGTTLTTPVSTVTALGPQPGGATLGTGPAENTGPVVTPNAVNPETQGLAGYRPSTVKPTALPGDRSGWAIASLIVGLIGLIMSMVPFCGLLLPILGAIFGFMGLGSLRRPLAIIGIILCVLGLGLSVLVSLGVTASFLNSGSSS